MLLRQRLMAYIDAGIAPGGFTYADSVVQAMLDAAASTQTVGQAYNISGGTGATWKQYAKLFAEQLAVKPPWINLSFAPALKLARVFESAHAFLSSEWEASAHAACCLPAWPQPGVPHRQSQY